MFIGHCSNFVCLSDVSGTMEGMNTVIHNPNIDVELDREVLHKSILEKFNVSLRDADLDRLVKYDKEHLNEFIDDIRGIIMKERALIFA